MADSFIYTVFPHRDQYAPDIVTPNGPHLGDYFRDSSHLANGLNAWAKVGWQIPGIAVAWESFGNDLQGKPRYGYRIRNAGAPVLHGEGQSAVVAMRPAPQKQPAGRGKLPKRQMRPA